MCALFANNIHSSHLLTHKSLKWVDRDTQSLLAIVLDIKILVSFSHTD